MSPSVTEKQLFALVRKFLLALDPCPGFEVIRAQENRVAMPKAPLFVQLTPKSRVPLSTTQELPDYQNPDASTLTFLHKPRVNIQADIFGEGSADFATIVAGILRTPWAASWFAAENSAIAPLFATEGQQMPLTTSEQQYKSRWTQELAFQVNARFLTNQDYMATVQPKVINVEATYPAED